MQFVRPLIGAAVTGVLLLSGCSLGGDPAPSESASGPTPTASESTPAGDGTFAAPADCTAILPQDQVDTMFAAGPAPKWTGKKSSAGAAGTATNVSEFITAVNELPKWRSIAVNFAGESVSLRRTSEGN